MILLFFVQAARWSQESAPEFSLLRFTADFAVTMLENECFPRNVHMYRLLVPAAVIKILGIIQMNFLKILLNIYSGMLHKN